MKWYPWLAVALLASSPAWAGPLTGKTLGAESVFNGNVIFPGPTAVVVDPGVEFTSEANGNPLTFDFSESGLLTVTFSGPDLDQGGDFRFTDVLSAIDPIVGFERVSGTFISPGSLTFTENSITLDLTGLSFARFTARIEFAAVPEPGSLALMGIALTALAATRRHSRSRASPV